DLDAAAEAVADVIQDGVDVATLELIDRDTAAIANSYTGAVMPDTPMVFVELHGRTPAAVE
ncbi:MAG: hypothetical protein GWN85_11065, partial [Gemmatimonadetes bacterium]|nr:hypothetical protein [Gemmatimonadota bacterium]NIS32914.1 hypothetical protein [Actinomycetota bacterium]NIU67877.1 hypothetical protein [Actinomycetota bacterium]NIV88225.1 hypothetical protein [Actinomycetota bacterium]NIW29655.1 hypothetical protein [Actinomycetota bacterium]